jgi:hypothetical protein
LKIKTTTYFFASLVAFWVIGFTPTILANGSSQDHEYIDAPNQYLISSYQIIANTQGDAPTKICSSTAITFLNLFIFPNKGGNEEMLLSKDEFLFALFRGYPKFLTT